MTPFPIEVLRLGPLSVTDTVIVTAAVSVLLVLLGRVALLSRAARETAEIIYETVEGAITGISSVDVRPLVPLVITQWLFIGATNLVGLVPGLQSPTRDLSLAAALAVVSFVAGHVFAFRARGIAYLKQYLEPNPLLLPLNIIGEVSRTIALALRLFGNMLSGALVSAIFLYIAGLLVPVPLMLLSALTGIVQAYIFGVLTLVFATSSLEAAMRLPRGSATGARPPPLEPEPKTQQRRQT